MMDGDGWEWVVVEGKGKDGRVERELVDKWIMMGWDHADNAPPVSTPQLSRRTPDPYTNQIVH